MSKNLLKRELGQNKTKNLLPQTIPDKTFGTKWSTPIKLEGQLTSMSL